MDNFSVLFRRKFGGGPGFGEDYENLTLICRNYTNIIQFGEFINYSVWRWKVDKRHSTFNPLGNWISFG